MSLWNAAGWNQVYVFKQWVNLLLYEKTETQSAFPLRYEKTANCTEWNVGWVAANMYVQSLYLASWQENWDLVGNKSNLQLWSVFIHLYSDNLMVLWWWPQVLSQNINLSLPDLQYSKSVLTYLFITDISVFAYVVADKLYKSTKK